MDLEVRGEKKKNRYQSRGKNPARSGYGEICKDGKDEREGVEEDKGIL